MSWHDHHAADFRGAELRAELIEAGKLRPGRGPQLLSPVRLPAGTVVLRLDAAGRKAAETTIARPPRDANAFDRVLDQELRRQARRDRRRGEW